MALILLVFAHSGIWRRFTCMFSIYFGLISRFSAIYLEVFPLFAEGIICVCASIREPPRAPREHSPAPQASVEPLRFLLLLIAFSNGLPDFRQAVFVLPSQAANKS